MAAATRPALGYPRVHLRRTDSTNERARALAAAGAPHGTLVTSDEQTAGRGRQGRTWITPPGGALLASVVLRDPPALLSLVAAVAVCDAIGDRLDNENVRVKWPNDIVVRRTRPPGQGEPPADEGSLADGNAPPLAKLAGILVEGRPQEDWAVLGIGVNVAVRPEDVPYELSATAASLALPTSEIEPLLDRLLDALDRRLTESEPTVLDAWRARDALLGSEVSWGDGHGTAQGVDRHGHLLVRLSDGTTQTLSAGEVHLRAAA
jgi:BirA family transcriptional regulator, biotin operon repressor / biotin---[acetyl-CoA-carboxylase] ligase